MLENLLPKLFSALNPLEIDFYNAGYEVDLATWLLIVGTGEDKYNNEASALLYLPLAKAYENGAKKRIADEKDPYLKAYFSLTRSGIFNPFKDHGSDMNKSLDEINLFEQVPATSISFGPDTSADIITLRLREHREMYVHELIHYAISHLLLGLRNAEEDKLDTIINENARLLQKNFSQALGIIGQFAESDSWRGLEEGFRIIVANPQRFIRDYITDARKAEDTIRKMMQPTLTKLDGVYNG